MDIHHLLASSNFVREVFYHHPNLSAGTAACNGFHPVQCVGGWHCHTMPSASPGSPSLSHLCCCPFLTSDVDLDFPAVLAPSRGDPALPEPCVCLRQVPHLKLAGDLPWLDDGFDEL